MFPDRPHPFEDTPMLRLSSIALLAALGFTAFNTPARAETMPELNLVALDDAAPPPPDGPRGEKGDHKRGEHLRERLHAMLFHGITLSEDQKAQLKKLQETKKAEMEKFRADHKDELEAFGKSMKDWHEANKPKFKAIREAMRDAAEKKDEDALKKARADLKALLESRPKPSAALEAGKPSPEKMAAAIRPILTADQAKIFDENVKKLEAAKERLKNRGGDDRKDGDQPRRHRKGDQAPKAD